MTRSLNIDQRRILGSGAKVKKAKCISLSGKRTLNILGQKVFGLFTIVKNVVNG